MKIKIFLGSLLSLGASMTLTSCHGDLDIQQPSQFTSLTMWVEESDFTTAINGAYTLFRSNYAAEMHCIYGDLRADYLESGAVNDAFFNTYGPKNKLRISDSGTNWAGIYTTINAVNLVIRHIDDVQFSRDETRKEVLANAYFLRGYLYYLIARVWGDAPVLTSGFESERQEDMYPSRNPVAEVYAQAESDMEQAAALIPSGKNLHKASPAAINMLRADYYSWKASRLNGGNEALTKAQTAVNAVLSAGYTLLPNFADLIGTENENNAEFIFTMPFNVGENVTAGTSPNFYAYFPAPSSQWLIISNNGYTQEDVPTGSHTQYVAPQKSFCDLMKAEPRDTRTDLTLREFEDEFIKDEMQIERMIMKFLGSWANETRSFDSDMPIYRLAEAYLLKAEIENKLGNTSAALDALNTVAARAYGVENYYTTTDKDEITEAICNETLKELALEGKIWWTYLRNNVEFKMIPSLVGRENELNILLWPVAQASHNTNPNIDLTPGLDK